MRTRTLTLSPQPQWPAAPAIPRVSVRCTADETALRFAFDVSEPPECHRCLCAHDGAPCWQDSCVEVFLRSGDGYYNFECNSDGFCLGEFGASRSPRRALTPHEYAQIHRTAHKTTHGGIVLWQLDIEIPRAFLGLSPQDPIEGNLYKCASSAPVPHYLCAFPISTPAPDFHRPEFFRDIWDG